MHRVAIPNKIYTFFVAFYLCVPAINAIIAKVLPVLSGSLMSLLYIVVGAYILLFTFGSILKTHKVNLIGLMVFLLILAYYLFTIILTPYSDLSIVKFVTMTLIAMLCPYNKNINAQLFVKDVMIIPTFGILFLDKVFAVKGI